jgi:hypothetical protein
VINQGIDEQAILEANKPPSGQWETEEAITQQYHRAYPTGFPTLTGENQNQNDDKVETPETSSTGPAPMSPTPSTSNTKRLRDMTPTKASPSPKKTKQI